LILIFDCPKIDINQSMFQTGYRKGRKIGMNREEAEQYLYYAMTIGEQLLISGAEVGRVEDTIRRICMAYGASRVDVFSITSSIVTTMYGEGFGICTQTRRVPGMANNLGRLDDLNQLSRYICAERPKPEVIKERLAAIDRAPGYSFQMQILIYAVISGSFSVFFGGDFQDMIASALIGIALKLLEAFIKKSSINPLITVFLCCGAGGILSNFTVLIGLGHHADLISIGNIMLLIPGIAFTNSLRDMFSGDTITGLIRCMESILLALVVGMGFAAANLLF